MKRKAMAIIVPPIAVCRYGCASCCAAPIALFWITGIVSLVYGYFGGPLDVAGISWTTAGLGLIMWIIAAVWAEDTIKGVDDDQCEDNQRKSICRVIKPDVDDTDPFEQIEKTNH